MENQPRADRAATAEEVCVALSISPKTPFEFTCICGVDCPMKFDLSDTTFVLAEDLAWMELAREARDIKLN